VVRRLDDLRSVWLGFFGHDALFPAAVACTEICRLWQSRDGGLCKYEVVSTLGLFLSLIGWMVLSTAVSLGLTYHW
jgi:hypothetical protein